MTDRNRAWIPVIEARRQDGPVLAAFGALHLSGETACWPFSNAKASPWKRLDL